jgi:hypothetical protein
MAISTQNVSQREMGMVTTAIADQRAIVTIRTNPITSEMETSRAEVDARSCWTLKVIE